MELCAAAGNIQIKQEGSNFFLFVGGKEVERRSAYAPIAKLATEIHVAKAATNDSLIGKQMFAPAAVGSDNPIVVVVAKVEHGYLVQRVGTDQRFPILPELLSEVPAQLFK